MLQQENKQNKTIKIASHLGGRPGGKRAGIVDARVEDAERRAEVREITALREGLESLLLYLFPPYTRTAPHKEELARAMTAQKLAIKSNDSTKRRGQEQRQHKQEETRATPTPRRRKQEL